MNAVVEGRISIAIPAECTVTRFDGQDHGLSHCMKAVDFLLTTPSSLVFLELKDPDDGPAERSAEWEEKLRSGVIDNELKGKFRDTWLYLYAQNRLIKPVNYLVLICRAQLSSETLRIRTENLKRQIPLEGPSGPWAKPLLAGCAVHNLASWNRSFSSLHASRI